MAAAYPTGLVAVAQLTWRSLPARGAVLAVRPDSRVRAGYPFPRDFGHRRPLRDARRAGRAPVQQARRAAGQQRQSVSQPQPITVGAWSAGSGFIVFS
jgi:hypothetical protein